LFFSICPERHTETHTWTCKHRHRQTDRISTVTDRQTDREIKADHDLDNSSGADREKSTERQAERQSETDRITERQRNKQR